MATLHELTQALKSAEAAEKVAYDTLITFIMDELESREIEVDYIQLIGDRDYYLRMVGRLNEEYAKEDRVLCDCCHETEVKHQGDICGECHAVTVEARADEAREGDFWMRQRLGNV